jgi:putative flippase GtrA
LVTDGPGIIDRLVGLVAPERFQRFLVTGGLGMVVDMAVLALVVETGWLRPVLGKVVSAESAFLVMFVVNETWTFSRFGTGEWRDLGRRFASSHGVRLLGVAIALGVLYVLHSLYGVWYLLANAAGIGVGFLANYTFESLVTWRVHREP